MKTGKVINQFAPKIYREIVKKLFERYPSKRITRKEAKSTLGLCFKIGKYKGEVLRELVNYGLLVFLNKQEFFINYVELKETGEKENDE